MATEAGLDLRIRVPIRVDGDIVTARQQGRTLAEQVGFDGSDLTCIATAISELGRNMLKYAGGGEVILCPANVGSIHGIVVIAHDEGPGIPDLALARHRTATRRRTAWGWVCRAPDA